jgi:alpha-ketoglutarate-dependent taurine dioxygenase
MKKLQHLDALEEFGWVEIRDVSDNIALSHLADALGSITSRTIALLTPSSKGKASSRSFSYHYGRGQFPMHSDTAFWPTPARYVVLRSAEPCNTSTLLMQSPELRRILHGHRVDTAIFSIRTTAGNSYGKAIFSREPFGIRFDPCYMKATNSDARKLIESLSFPDSNSILKFTWTGSNALIIDNWKCLHARAPIDNGDTERRLSRIYVGGSQQ